MASWNDFEREVPEIAKAGRALLYHFGPGLGYLATVRPDGGPRIHPICPVQEAGSLYAFITRSPKRADLLRNRHYALHSFPLPEGDDEFFVSGRATQVQDAAVRMLVDHAIAAQGTTHSDDELLFELSIDRALHSAYAARGAWPPTYSKWRAAD